MFRHIAKLPSGVKALICTHEDKTDVQNMQEVCPPQIPEGFRYVKRWINETQTIEHLEPINEPAEPESDSLAVDLQKLSYKDLQVKAVELGLATDSKRAPTKDYLIKLIHAKLTATKKAE